MKENNLTIQFASGARSVTGSNFLVSLGSRRFLIDCGLVQGHHVGAEENAEPFPYDVSGVDALFVTHGHLDHVGRIPKIVKDGFKSRIISTPPTKEIGAAILEDALNILRHEAQQDGREPLYAEEDTRRSFSLWETVLYDKPVIFTDPEGDISVTLRDTGHILGSAMIDISRGGKHFVFTGDLGNTPSPLLRDTEEVPRADYLCVESVYGDRNHDPKEYRKKKLKTLIEEGIKRGGTVVIPAFSTERTQELLFELNEMVEHKEFPKIPIYLDSPLSIKITAIYQKYKSYFNPDTLSLIKKGDDIFNFPGLIVTGTSDESRAINFDHRPKVVIASSGMLNGGRVIHHAKHYLPDPKSTFIIVGYQAAGTPGRLLEDGIREVKITGEMVKVRANIVSLNGYSAHKDSDHLLEFVEGMNGLRKVFVVLGEPKASMFLAQRIRDNIGVETLVPEKGEIINVPF